MIFQFIIRLFRGYYNFRINIFEGAPLIYFWREIQYNKYIYTLFYNRIFFIKQRYEVFSLTHWKLFNLIGYS